MNDENIQSGSVGSNDSGTSTAVVTGNDSVNSGCVAVVNPNLKPGVPVEDIGVTQEQAALLGLLKSEADYKAEEAAKIAQLEAMDHSYMLDEATDNLVQSVRASLAAAINLGDVTNQVYGKFMHLGMASQSEALRNLNSNVHFNKMIELLEQVKAHSILLRVEMSDI